MRGRPGGTKRSPTGARPQRASPHARPPASSRGRRRYFNSVKEVWARSYAQAALMRSDDPSLRRHVDELIAADDIFVWPAPDFAPVAERSTSFDSLGFSATGSQSPPDSSGGLVPLAAKPAACVDSLHDRLVEVGGRSSTISLAPPVACRGRRVARSRRRRRARVCSASSSTRCAISARDTHAPFCASS